MQKGKGTVMGKGTDAIFRAPHGVIREFFFKHGAVRIFMLTAGSALLVCLWGCGTPPGQGAPEVAGPDGFRINLAPIGADLKKVAADVGPPQTTDKKKFGQDVQKLGADLPTLGGNLQTLNVPVRGKQPTKIETDLATLGAHLTAPGTDLTRVGADLLNNPADLTAAQNQLSGDIPIADLKTVAADLKDLTLDTNVIIQDFKPRGLDADALSGHLVSLASDASQPGGLGIIGPDLQNIGADFSTAGKAGNLQATNEYGKFQIVAGYINLNPYKVQPVMTSTPNGAQTSSRLNTSQGTDGAATIQLLYARRWAWDERSTIRLSGTESIFRPGEHGLLDFFDIEARAGYSFGSFTNSASSIIGSGSLDLEGGIGLQLLRWNQKKETGSLNFEIAAENSSDGDFDTAHTTVFAGPAYATSFPIFSTNRSFLLLRMGYAKYDVPAFNANGSVAFNNIGNLQFSRVGGFAMEFEAAIPITQSLYAVANARIYPEHDIAPWTAWVGVSMSLEQISTALKSLTGL